jgi:hypothetical protein
MSTYGCSPCGETFGTLTLFDGHQDVDRKRRPVVRCADPRDLGLVQDGHGVWQTPEGLAARERATERLRRNRA